MKKIINFTKTTIFVTATVAGSFVIGSGVFAQTATSAVLCQPSTYTLPVGQSVTLEASGGDSNYMWSSPGLVVTNPTGSNFRVSFNSAGTYPVTVTSAGVSSTCYVTATAPVPVPGLPNTGELPE